MEPYPCYELVAALNRTLAALLEAFRCLHSIGQLGPQLSPSRLRFAQRVAGDLPDTRVWAGQGAAALVGKQFQGKKCCFSRGHTLSLWKDADESNSGRNALEVGFPAAKEQRREL